MSDKPMIVREVSDEELHVTLLSRNELIREIREKLKEFAGKKGFDDDEIFDMQLAVNEALANIIEHAYAGYDRGKIEIKINSDEKGGVVISIRDYGNKCDPEVLKPRDLDVLEEGGLGIFLINNLMDEVEYDHSPEDGTILKLKKYKKSSS